MPRFVLDTYLQYWTTHLLSYPSANGDLGSSKIGTLETFGITRALGEALFNLIRLR